MSKPDVNLFSFTGDAAGNIWLNGEILFWAKDYKGKGDTRRYTLNLDDPKWAPMLADKMMRSGYPVSWSDTIKLSGVKDFVLTILGKILGGAEDCVDINNRCERVEVMAMNGFHPQGRYLATIKGGSRDISLVGPVLTKGDVTDVAIGEHSDQSQKPTTGVSLDLAPQYPDGVIDYWVFNGTRPKVHKASVYHCEFKLPGFWRRTFVVLYALGKKLGLPI